MIEIYPLGSTVSVGDIKCRVISVSLIGHEGHTTIRYEVSWLINGDRKTAWIESFEISTSQEGKLSVGFKE